MAYWFKICRVNTEFNDCRKFRTKTISFMKTNPFPDTFPVLLLCFINIHELTV